jgi:hypothetical protein
LDLFQGKAVSGVHEVVDSLLQAAGLVSEVLGGDNGPFVLLAKAAKAGQAQWLLLAADLSYLGNEGIKSQIDEILKLGARLSDFILNFEPVKQVMDAPVGIVTQRDQAPDGRIDGVPLLFAGAGDGKGFGSWAQIRDFAH